MVLSDLMSDEIGEQKSRSLVDFGKVDRAGIKIEYILMHERSI